MSKDTIPAVITDKGIKAEVINNFFQTTNLKEVRTEDLIRELASRTGEKSTCLDLKSTQAEFIKKFGVRDNAEWMGYRKSITNEILYLLAGKHLSASQANSILDEVKEDVLKHAVLLRAD